MRSMICTIAACLLFVTVGCGDDDDPKSEPLPKAPQAYPSTAFIAFSVVEAGSSQIYSMAIVNGGQGDLVIDQVSLTDDAGGAFSVVPIASEDKTAKSLLQVSIQVEFAPPSRGMYLGTLQVTSNAENIETMEFDVIGPASASPRLEQPDILAAEDPAAVITELGAASVRYINLGQASLVVTEYEITDDNDDAFDFAPGVAQPMRRAVPTGGCTQEEMLIDAECVTPINIGPGQFVPVGVAYAPAASGTHTANFVIHSNDPDQPTLTVGLTGTN